MAEKKKSTSQSQVAASKSGSEKGAARSARTAPRTSKQEGKSARKGKNTLLGRFRSTRFGGFIYDAYYELRYKVTWPSFQQARNMTIAVLIISGVVGLLLWLVDTGLYYLFIQLIGGGK
jgi:preprotein translocase SecE subunit|nr:hypothetical protein KTC_46200 [Thermosporothrix sp. COM3]